MAGSYNSVELYKAMDRRDLERRRTHSPLLMAGAACSCAVFAFAETAWARTAPASIVAAMSPALVRSVLYLLVILTLALCVSLIAFLRWSRHFRRFILRPPAPPTPSEDVWQMHRLPEEAEGDDVPPPDHAAGES